MMYKNDNWEKQHGEVIADFLKFLNKTTDDFILKGDTSLMMCYGLDRFSEDIDLDGRNNNIEKIINDFCNMKNYSYRTAKDTDTVKRYMINYGEVSSPLKVEISFRKKVIRSDEITKINGINVYTIENICIMKTNAYNNRDKIRDLYDLSYICNNYWNKLPEQVKSNVRNTVSYKGIEQFDYLIRNQSDNLIDKEKLANDFLIMFDKLDLLADKEELQMISEFKNNIDENKQLSVEDWNRISESKEIGKVKNDSIIEKKTKENDYER